VTDTAFLASVVVLLVVRGGAGEVRAGLATDDERRLFDSVAAGRAQAGEIRDLAAAVRGVADTDPGFRERLRVLVVAAYADPAVSPGLPDPSPRW
jgi:hypothetical protein